MTRLAARKTASTSAAGWRAAACTSCSTAATGGSSAGAGVSAASPIGSARMSRARSPLGSRGSGARVLAGIVLGEDEGLSDELRDSFKASGPLPPAGGVGPEHHLPRARRARARLVARSPTARRRGRRDRGDRRLRARGRLAALGRPGRCRGRARLARVALCRGRATAGTSSRSAQRSCSPGIPASLLEPGFQLSFAAVGSIFLLLPRLQLALEGYPLTELAARRARGLDRLRSGHRADPVAPVRERAGLLAARERARHPGDRPAARPRARRLAARSRCCRRRHLRSRS